MKLLEDDFCPSPRDMCSEDDMRWADAIEAVLMTRVPKFLISGHTSHMLSVGALFRARAYETGGHLRLMYEFVQRIQSNSAMQYMNDADLWYSNVVDAHFLERGPQYASFRSSISCMLMTALGRDVYKVRLARHTYAAVLLPGTQTWMPADAWSASFATLIGALIKTNTCHDFDGWAICWARSFAAFAVRCAACLQDPTMPLELEDWVPFKSSVSPVFFI
jgi:hypothetical protein